mmetsp:Transcript_27547/g.86879  ORF Transcript_27547/g.86879 Transcript_27547/m.86879 type:complete len:100 (-) Transcript_27547:1423-1722(-)
MTWITPSPSGAEWAAVDALSEPPSRWRSAGDLAASVDASRQDLQPSRSTNDNWVMHFREERRQLPRRVLKRDGLGVLDVLQQPRGAGQSPSLDVLPPFQ